MKIEERESGRGIRLLAALVKDSSVLARASGSLNGEMLFNGPIENTLLKLCVNFYRKYGKSPRREGFKQLVRDWSEGKPDTTVEGVSRLAALVLAEYDARAGKINTDYFSDRVAEYMDRNKADAAMEKARALLDTGRTGEAIDALAALRRISMDKDATISLVQDDAEVVSTFDEVHQESMIAYPDGLGKFFKGVLHRDNFLAFVAPEKNGKTWIMIDLAWRAAMQRRRTIFFEMGDLAKWKTKRRFLQRAAGLPVDPEEEVLYPVGIKVLGSGEVDIEKERRDLPLLNAKNALKACRRIMRRVIKSDEPYFKLVWRPNHSTTVAEIRGVLDQECHSGWVPDVVVIDYADLLVAPSSGRMEARDQINLMWKELRALSTEYHVLLVTATQCNRLGYEVKHLRMKHIGEDKRKLAHARCVVGITPMTDEDKEAGIIRMNWVVADDMKFSSSKSVICAGCLAVGEPAVFSVF